MPKGPGPPPLPANPAPGSLDNGPLTHRYRLLAHRPDVYPGGTNRLVSQHQFPISTTVTGALMQIKPGALREPHWHPNANEWQYYISGRAHDRVRIARARSHRRVQRRRRRLRAARLWPLYREYRQRRRGTADRAQQWHL